MRPSLHTTPESRDLFELMAEGAQRGATELVTEVSSHALDQGRAAGIPFDVAVFTNLTRDHLDYHGTMEKYFAAKRLLFDGTVYPAPRVAVLNAHDPRARSSSPPPRAEPARRSAPTASAIGDWRAASYTLTPAGAAFDLETPAGSAQVASRLAGEVNILNLLAAFTAAHARGVPFDDLVDFVPHLNPVPGRFQPVDAGQPFTVIVDYAHTDDALRNLTALARQMTAQSGGRVITLFGCGGDRDRTKRPKMGLAAGEGSDFVVATSDNPRSEDPRRHPRRNRARPRRPAASLHHRAGSRRCHSPRTRSRAGGRRCPDRRQRPRKRADSRRPHHSFRRRRNCAFRAGRIGLR